MNDEKLWAVYSKDGRLTTLETKDNSGRITTRRPCITSHITEVGKMLKEVQDMAGPETREDYFVVRGTFIPEEKL